jgi:stearoyl-CoA desaturase (delta-9 desaturase)
MHLAHVKKVAPAPLAALQKTTPIDTTPVVDLEMVSTIIATRMHVLRAYARQVTLPVLRVETQRRSTAVRRYVGKLLVRHPMLLEPSARARLAQLLAEHSALRTVHDFRDRLATLWSGKIGNNERLIAHLRTWIQEAEHSGVAALEQFAVRLSGVSAETRRRI